MIDVALPWIRRTVLTLMLVLACLVGNVAPYIVALLLIGLWVALLVGRRLAGAYRPLLATLFLVAFLALGLAFALTAEAPRDVAFVVNFVMLVLAAPLLAAFNAGATPDRTRLIAWLCLAGAGVGLIVVLVALALGSSRGFWVALGPIRLSNTVLLLGFLALMGLFVPGGRARWALLGGPVLGLAAIVLTESRGPLLALALLVPVALGFGFLQLPRRLRLPLAAAVLLLTGAATYLVMSQARFAILPDTVAAVLSGGSVADETTSIRLVLYRAAVQAFGQSPWLGHGWDELMTAIVPFLDVQGRNYAAQLPQLHNDVLDFAVAAGVAGIIIYVLLLAAPIVAALRSTRDSQWRARLYGACVLVAAYAGAGLTDLMFGFEFHTALYVVLATMLIGYCRDRPVVMAGPEEQDR